MGPIKNKSMAPQYRRKLPAEPAGLLRENANRTTTKKIDKKINKQNDKTF
jgi:hypothetical protein